MKREESFNRCSGRVRLNGSSRFQAIFCSFHSCLSLSSDRRIEDFIATSRAERAQVTSPKKLSSSVTSNRARSEIVVDALIPFSLSKMRAG